MDPQQLIARLRTLTSSFSPGQLVTLGVTFLLVVGIVAGSAWWLNAPTYALLFSDMDAESAGQIVTRLKTLKVPYQLDEGGGAIRVPADRLDELRLELTSQGLPASGRVGFEIFDRTAFGATQFLEQVNYRRALEGEIARTIATITEVANARVHIAMGKESLFGEPRPAKASVVLKLRGQRGLADSTVAGISNLVAASVEGLRSESVVILDSFGRPLARPRDSEQGLAAEQVERQQRLEREMATRVVALLEPVVGPDRVRVNVAVKLNPQSVEQTEERWDPNSVIRTRQTQVDQSTGATPGVAGAAGGVAGARANLPPQPGDQQAAVQLPAGPSSSRNAETTSFEVSRTTRHLVQPAGEIARLSVAVILDDDQVAKAGNDGQTTIERTPRTPEEIQKIQGLVAAAVGLETERGDQLTVENVSFDEPVVIEEPPPSFATRYSTQLWEGGRIAAVAVIGLLAFFMFVRPLMRRAGVHGLPAAAGAGGAPVTALPTDARAPRTVAQMESEIDAELDAVTAKYAEERRLPVLTRRVSAVTVNEPENVARLLRAWINDSDR